MRRRARVDRNHSEIVNALERCGCSVQSLASLGRGCPDLLVGSRGADGESRNLLIEVKAPKGTPTPDQIEWASGWRGQMAIVRSVEEAIAVVRQERSQ